MPASGKGEVSRIRPGGTREDSGSGCGHGGCDTGAVKAAGLPVTDENLGAMSGKLRSELGMDAIARITIPLIEAEAAPVVLVDGIRGITKWRRFGSTSRTSHSSGSYPHLRRATGGSRTGGGLTILSHCRRTPGPRRAGTRVGAWASSCAGRLYGRNEGTLEEFTQRSGPALPPGGENMSLLSRIFHPHRKSGSRETGSVGIDGDRLYWLGDRRRRELPPG